VKALEVGYGEWSAALHRRARTGRLPINGSIEVTHRCPLACVHCYNNLPVGDQEARRRELDTDEMRRVIDEIADAGGLWLLFTGGEIFARRDFLDIYKHAKQRGFLVTLFTNGTQITPAIADTLAEWPPFAVEITIYGRTRETYERLTGVVGSFDRCMRGIELLRERHLPLKLKTVAVSINRHEVGDMQQLADELGVEFKFDGMINARIDCSHSPLEVRLSPLEMVELDVGDPVREAAWRGLMRTRPVGLPTAADQVYHCGGGVSSFAIDPEGKMSICVLSHQDTFDLRAGSFQDGWNRFLGEVRAKKATRRTKCTDCRIRELCSTCAATAELEHGDAEAPVEYFCEVAHLRAHALGHEPPAHGSCDFCEGGRYHARVLADSVIIKSGVPSRPRRRPSLAVVSDRRAVGTSCGSGGCEACGSPPMQGEQ
jgi:radical SAM protein with 4Fe4S-binding SPASM domain